MARPGVIFTESSAPASRGAPTDTATLFVTGVTERGPVNKAVLIRSCGDYKRIYGESYGATYDYLDVFFREGGTRAYVARQAGPGAAVATVNIPGATGTSIVATAAAPGAYYNQLDVKSVSSGTGYKLQIFDGNGVLLAESAELADKNAASSFTNDYVVFSAGAGAATPTTGNTAYSLAGGADDTAGVTQTQKGNALALFPKTLGPGRVAAPGDTNAAMHSAMAVHAEATNRIAFVDIGDTPTVGTLTSAAATRSAYGDADRLAMFAGSVLVPGQGGVTRIVALSAAVAGVEARKERMADVSAVGAFDDWPFSYVTGLTQNYSDADVETLVQAGVNVAKDVFGSLELFSYVTAQPRNDGTYWMLNAANIRMAIQAQAERIGYHFLGKTIDGQGRNLGALEGALKGVLLGFFETGALFGQLPSDAFNVVCDFGNNPPESLAAGDVFASLNVRISPYAEQVTIDLVTTPITQAITV